MRKKRLLNRKRRTARYLLALVLVVALSSLMGFYTFTPGRAAVENADRNGIADAHVVGRFWAPDLAPERGRWLYLVESERAMLLCPVEWDLFNGGWYGGMWCVAETWDGQGLYGGVLQNQDTGVGYVFGRVDDPRIREVLVEQNYPWGESGIKGDCWNIQKTAYFEKEGKRYFLESFSWELNHEIYPEYSLIGQTYGPESNLPMRKIRCATWS